jgi:DNA-binding MarR family transcriptional regulator
LLNTANLIHRLLARIHKDQFSGSDLQWRIIAILAEFGPLAPKQLILRTGLDKAVVTRIANSLSARGLLLRQPNRRDGRSRILTLSAQGMACYDKLTPLVLAVERDLIAEWTLDELQNFHDQLIRLQDTASELARTVME